MSHPFVVVFLARSGSTALYGNLRQVPNIEMKAEIFGERALPDQSEQTDDNRIRYLRRYWAAFRQPGRNEGAPSRGFKFQIDRKNNQFGKPRRLANVMLEYQPKIIVLRRRNVVKQALSSLNARRLAELSKPDEGLMSTGHITHANIKLLDHLAQDKMSVSIEHLKAMLSGIRHGQQRLQAFADCFSDKLEIFYEEYAADRNGVLGEVLRYLDIDVDPADVPDAYFKITSDDLSKTIANYDELQRFVANTEYESMLGPS